MWKIFKDHWKGIIISFILILLIPFLTNQFVFHESFITEILRTYGKSEDWFSFMGSYIGAIAAVMLGVIALYQNKKYKELADESTSNMNKIMEEIKKYIKQSNLPIIEFYSTGIFEEIIKLPVKDMNSYWGNSKKNEIFYFKIINEQIEENDDSLMLTRKLSFYIKNLSDFPIQFIKLEKVIFHNKKIMIYKGVHHAIQGYLGAGEENFCEMEIFDTEENCFALDEKKLDISIEFNITDAKGLMHNKQFHIISVNREYNSEGNNYIWSDTVILNSKVKNI